MTTAAACGSKRNALPPDSASKTSKTVAAADENEFAEVAVPVAVSQRMTDSDGEAYIPRAVIYKTNGDYNDNVTITLNRQRTAPATFPDPHDVGANSTPLQLADGWLLDRRGGIGEYSVFLTYTYSQYATLPAPPSIENLMKAIIPGAQVTDAVRLTIPASPIDTAKCNQLIRMGLPGCTTLLESVTLTVEE